MENQELENDIKNLEDENNYFALFSFTYKSACELNYKVQQAFGAEKIDDFQFQKFIGRINLAKMKMIETHKQWIIKNINRNDVEQRKGKQLTNEQLINSVFNTVFNEK